MIICDKSKKSNKELGIVLKNIILTYKVTHIKSFFSDMENFYIKIFPCFFDTNLCFRQMFYQVHINYTKITANRRKYAQIVVDVDGAEDTKSLLKGECNATP